MNTHTARTATHSKPWSGSYRLSQWLPSGRSMVIAVPYLFLLLFFMLPFLIVFKISLADSRMG
ncbi:MAG: putrescine ABC transporter permease PotH, partial [Rhodoferax sp.]|nr:putrescine ABC transporter permease PotH [Rhodoferax sp.]